MSLSPEWNSQYLNNSHLSVFPWNDLISLTMRHTQLKTNGKAMKVLELGCGAGANIGLFKKFGANYYAVDGSPAIVKLLQESYPEYASNICVADFTKEIPFKEEFDLIFDRASLTHNKTVDIKNSIRLFTPLLKKNAPFIGVHWFSTRSPSFKLGESTDCTFTKNNYKEGPFAGVGNVHFTDEKQLREIFSAYNLDFLQHLSYETVVPAGVDHMMYNFVVRKN